ncbi:MAG TPA: hypothetical protein VHU80_19315 [Polyangiaceae bacterium]|jgi:hypothetical protein|nr:hypothetical protein [Polyangiaceae bacterium]
MRKKACVKSTTLALVVLLLAEGGALGAPADSKTRAAELFEQGVRQFSSSQYESAAQAFLAADELMPNTRALINGITAARRAGMHLIVARAAERALARPDMDPGGTALAREALAEAARNLSVVEATCSPAPCTITVDGAAMAPSRDYVLPGTHDFAANGDDATTASEHLTCAAGASYRVALKLEAPAPVTAAPSPPATPQPSTPAPPPSFEASKAPHRPLTPAMFFAGAAGTAVLVGLTVWSGVDTLSAKSDAQSDPSSWPHVKSLALRTDLFLSGALVLGAATGVAGLWFVDWGSGRRATAVILPGGAAVAAEGRF